jgi:hypothetical protein
MRIVVPWIVTGVGLVTSMACPAQAADPPAASPPGASQSTALPRSQCELARLQAQSLAEQAARGGPEAIRLHEAAAAGFLDVWMTCGKGPLEAGQKAGCERLDEVLFNAAESFRAAHQSRTPTIS